MKNNIIETPSVVVTTITITEREGNTTAEMYKQKKSKGGISSSKKKLSPEQINKIIAVINGEGD